MKRKRFLLAAILSGAMLLTACGSTASIATSSAASSEAAPGETTAPASSVAESEVVSSEVTSSENTESTSNAIVVYFSWSGNTESVANEIAAQTGADVFELTPVKPYTDDYDTLLDVAQAEQRENARPEIAGSIENFVDYGTVYLGYPNWWGDMPMILYSFLEDYDLSGKTVAPFVTSGGSGFSNTISEMTALEPNATILEGLSLGSSAAAQPTDAVAEWLARLNLVG